MCGNKEIRVVKLQSRIPKMDFWVARNVVYSLWVVILLVIYYIDNVIEDHSNLVFDYEDIELGDYESSISTII
jgi:hypothetical protein